MEVLHSQMTRSIALFAFGPLSRRFVEALRRKLAHPTSMTFLLMVELLFATSGGLLLASL
jgi:hypothetical protein